MRSYSLPASQSTLDTVGRSASDVARIGICPGHSAHPGCDYCVLETSSGSRIGVFAGQHDLEHRFEVFPIEVAPDPVVPDDTEWHHLSLHAPIRVSLLRTEDWLDPSIPCDGALGRNPVAQLQGKPGSAPASAIAACQYVGGLEFEGSGAKSIFIATATFPLTLHVSGLAEDSGIDREDYDHVA